MVVGVFGREIGEYCIQAYLSFIQHRSLHIVCNPEGTRFSLFDNIIGFKDLGLVYSKSFEMNRQHTYEGQAFMLDG